MLSESWATLWEAIADDLPDHAAVVVGDRRLTWRELDQRAARLATGLAGLGVGPDVKVAQLLYNCPEYLETVYAAFKLRAVPLNVNHRYLADEIVHVLGNADAEVLVFHGSLADRVAEARSRLPRLRAVVQVDDGSPLLEGAHRYEDLVAASEPAPRIERAGSDILLLYTGGTTGLPKGVIWGHQDLWGALAFSGYVSMGLEMPESAAEVGRIAAELNDSGRSPVNLCAPPLMHGTALFLAIQTFVLGGTVVLLGGRRFDADELLRLVERERVTQISLVGDAFARPIVAALAAAEAAGRPYDLSSVQRVVSTGATFSADSKRGLTSRQPIAILDMIGASEGGPYAVNMTLPGQDPGETAAFTATPNTVLFDDVTWERLRPARVAPACWPSPAPCRVATSRTTRRRRPRSGRSAACATRSPATTRRSMPTAPSTCSAGDRSASTPAGRRCTPRRWRWRPAPIRAWPTATPSACPTSASARRSRWSSPGRPGEPAVTEAEVIATVREQPGRVQGAEGRGVRGRDRAQPGRQGGLPLGARRRRGRGRRRGLTEPQVATSSSSAWRRR